MPENSKSDQVAVYYLGYPGVTHQHATEIKGAVYLSPLKKDGTPDIGGVVMVARRDFKEFMLKNQYQRRSDPSPRNAYTVDPQVAALAKKSGTVIAAPAEMTATEALNLLDAEALRERLRQLEAVTEQSEAE